MGITGLIPFMEKASRRANISEFAGCTVAIDSYCWLHKGAFACADKLVRGEQSDIHIRYCLKYVNMLLSKNIKPILVFDGRHLPAKAQTEAKRRESRETAKKRAAELLRLGQTSEAYTLMRRGVDITHAMALQLIQECRAIGVDCIVAPYEADAQLAYLNKKNFAQVVITEDSDLVLFGCTKILFKMDLEGQGTLVDCSKLPLTLKCPIERYSLDKFRRVCIMSGCDYVSSLPGIGLAKAAQFVAPIQESNFANALRKLPSFFKKNIKVSEEYIESFLKAEATFKHQYVYDPMVRIMLRLTDPYEEGTDIELCSNAGERLDEDVALQLALGNIDPFTLQQMDNFDPDSVCSETVKTSSWSESATKKYPSIWHKNYADILNLEYPWRKKVIRENRNLFQAETRAMKKVVNVVVAETQDISPSIETLSKMYCIEQVSKKPKIDEKPAPSKSPILQNKDRSYRKFDKLKKFSKTTLSTDVIESKFFSESSEGQTDSSSQKENNDEQLGRNPFKLENSDLSNDILNDCTYPLEALITPACSQTSFGRTQSMCDQLDLNIQEEQLNKSNEKSKDLKDILSNFKSRRSFERLKPLSISGLVRDVENTNNLLRLKDVAEDISSDTVENHNSVKEYVNNVEEYTDPCISKTLQMPNSSNNTEWKSKNSHTKSNSILLSKNCVKTLTKDKTKGVIKKPSNQPTLLESFGFKRRPAVKM